MIQKRYLPSVLLSILLVFMTLAATLCLYAKYSLTHEKVCTELIAQEQLDVRVRENLNTYFSDRASSTGIPAATYMEHLSEEQLQQAIADSITNAYAYLNGNANAIGFRMDFTELEASVKQFFNDYADSIGHTKDEAFDKKVNATIDAAETQILTTADVFRFETMESAGLLGKVKRVMPYLDGALAGSLIGLLLLLLGLWLVHRKQPRMLLYWIGSSTLIASVLALIPLIYVKATDYFAGFSIKSTQIYAAVTGLLNRVTSQLFWIAIILLLCSILLLVLFALLSRRHAEQTTA